MENYMELHGLFSQAWSHLLYIIKAKHKYPFQYYLKFQVGK